MRWPGLAALLNAVRFADVDPNAGTGLELQVIAAVVVGGVAISGGRGTLAGSADRRRPARLDRRRPWFPRHAKPQWEKAIQGLIILLAVASDALLPGRTLRCRAPASPRSTETAIARRPLRLEPAQAILAALLLLEIVVFSVIGTNFLSLANAFEVLRLSVEIGLLAVALTPVITSGGIDLSVGSLMGLSAVVFGKLWRDAGLPIGAAAALTLVLGAWRAA